MAPPDGSRSTRIPTLSWDSVVEDGAPPADPSRPEVPVDAPAADAPLDTPSPSPAPAPADILSTPADAPPSAPLTPPIAFAPMSIAGVATPPAVPPTPPPAPPAPGPETPAIAHVDETTDAVADETTDAETIDDMADRAMVPIQFAPLRLDTSPVLHSPRAPLAETAAVRPPAEAAPEPAATPEPSAGPEPGATADAVPAEEPVTPASTVAAGSAPSSVVAPDAERPSTELPRIVEATPVPTVVEAVSAAPDPKLPQVQALAPAPPTVTTFDAIAPGATAVPTRRRRRKSRTGLKLLVTLVVLGGVIAGAVVFGRPYLFPGDWDAETGPFAEAVENARGVEFVEPITLTGEPTAAYNQRMATELAGDWTSDQPMWRALGLLNGAATPASVVEQIAGWQDAVYATEDGQVYRDEAVTGPKADAQITAALAAASIDQELRWSVEQAERALEAQVLTLAEVRRQSAQVVADSPYAVAVDPVDPAVLASVPPVVAYRLLAPAVYAEFDNPTGTLADIGTGGPGPLATPVPVAAPGPEPIGSDTIVTSPRAADRSFWYLVLAGFLDPRTAYAASESIVENAVTMAERGGAACAYATFAGGDVAQTASLRSALEAWSAAAPAEFSSSFAVLPDGTLQLVSCDPGVGFEHPNRQGVARELVGWRTAELATIEAVTAAFGPDADATDAWTIVEASDVGTDLASLPIGAAPAETAAAARAAITALFTPPEG